MKRIDLRGKKVKEDVIMFDELFDNESSEWMKTAHKSSDWNKHALMPTNSKKYIYYACQDNDNENIFLYRCKK